MTFNSRESSLKREVEKEEYSRSGLDTLGGVVGDKLQEVLVTE